MKRLPRSTLVLLVPMLASCAGAPEPGPAAPATSSSLTVSTTPPAPPPSPSAAPTVTAVATYPKAEKKPVVETHHGVKVVDDYRWLEDSKDPSVIAWSKAQNDLTRAHLDALPGRKMLHERVKSLLSSASPDHFALRWQGGKLFALKDQPPKQQAFLVTLMNADIPASEKTLVDPNVIDPKGGTTIDWYVPSRDGKLVAVSLSEGGSESGTVHVYEVATGKEKPDVIARVNGGTAGGDVAWNADGSGFWYTRYPRKGERDPVDLDFYQQVWFHNLGKPESTDVYVIGKEFPRIAEVQLRTSPDGKYVLAIVANGDGGEHAFYIASVKEGAKSAAWKKISDFADKVVGGDFGRDGNLWLRSLQDAPRGKILRLSPAKPDLASATVIVPQSDVVIQSFVVTATRLFVLDLVGGPSQIRIFGHSNGGPLGTVPILRVSAVREMVPLEGDDLLYRNQSYVTPPGWYRWSGGAKASKETKAPASAPNPVSKTALFQTSKADFSDAEVVRETCISKDGTKVPINILRRTGTVLDGKNPTILYGYGGYSVSMMPRFRARERVWLDQGGVYAVANLRGGGEFGEAWHKEGNLTKKQNVFDDFAACAQYLSTAGYAKPEKLAIMGGSNGGLLMGAAMTQHPELFRAVVSAVGIYDMLRVETTPNGAFNVTEFGTVKDKAQFDALYAYSPFHHVVEGTKYPAVLFLTGANDPRVDPYHSRKMTARLQAATGGASWVLLRTSGDTGHGMGTPLSAQIDEEVDIYGFLFEQLGVEMK